MIKYVFLALIGRPGSYSSGRVDSPYKNLNDLLDAVIADPANHAFAGGSAEVGLIT